jgi:hypothetical protein
MAKNIAPWLPRLFKENCCDEVVFAVREYDPSRYGALKRERIDRLALLRHIGLAGPVGLHSAPRSVYYEVPQRRRTSQTDCPRRSRAASCGLR